MPPPDAQPDLFAAPSRPPPPLGATEEVAALLRTRLHATLDLARGAQRPPWPDRIAAIHAENGFRHDLRALPEDEGAALWAAFDAELDRLYAAEDAEAGGV